MYVHKAHPEAQSGPEPGRLGARARALARQEKPRYSADALKVKIQTCSWSLGFRGLPGFKENQARNQAKPGRVLWTSDWATGPPGDEKKNWWGWSAGPMGEPKISRFSSFSYRMFFLSGVFSLNCGRGSRPWTTQIARLGFSGCGRAVRPPGGHGGAPGGHWGPSGFESVCWLFGNTVTRQNVKPLGVL